MSIVRAVGRTMLSAGALSVVALAPVTGAQAQTAAQLNHASQAIQICASPLAASIPQCAQLNAQLGLGGAAATGGNNGANAAAGLLGALAGARGSGGAGGLAGALGALANSAAASAATPQAAPQVMPQSVQATQMAYANCVQRAGVNTVAIQACASLLSGYTGAAPAYPGAVAPAYPAADYANQAAMATAAAGANYQACVAANPQNWQGCLAMLNGGAGVPMANAAVVPQAAPAQVAPNAAAALGALAGFLNKK